MIGRLTGIPNIYNHSSLIMDCNGVGYLVECSKRTLALVSEDNQGVLTLHITTLVRDDAIQLFGFSEQREQRWFELLKKIPGVGSKLSLQILSDLLPHFPGYYVARGDEAAFLAVNGVGKKLAGRLVSELKTHLNNDDGNAYDGTTASYIHPANEQIYQDSLSALTNLGYAPKEAQMAVEKAQEKHPNLTDSASIIKFALQEIRNLTSM